MSHIINILPNLIALEGIDGAGKTTVLSYLRNYGNEILTLIFKMMDMGPLGMKCAYNNIEIIDLPWKEHDTYKTIKELLKNGVKDKEEQLVLAKNFSDNRLMANLYINSSPNTLFIADRHIASFFAYQSLDINEETLYKMDSNMPIMIPIINIHIDIPVKLALHRIRKRDKKMEYYEDQAKLTVIKDNYNNFYNDITAKYINSNFSHILERDMTPSFKITHIDGTQDISIVTKSIVDIITDYILTNQIK
jgi:thymidylate kinase